MEANALTLNIKEKTLGTLVTNAKDIQSFVFERLKDYSAENYTGDEKKAKEDKAELNKIAEQFDEKRKSLKKEWDEPFVEFESIMTETSNAIKKVSNSLKEIVDRKIEEEKAAKKIEIEELWETKDFHLTTLNKIFNSKWLNKTYKINAISSDMDFAIKTINNDLAALDAFGEDTSTLKEFYLVSLDLQKTLTRGAEMKANREKLEEEKRRQEEAKKEVETANTCEETFTEKQNIEVKVEHVLNPVREENCKKTDIEPRYTFLVTGENVKRVAEIGRGLGLRIIACVAMSGTKDDITTFKNVLDENNLIYTKQAVTNLIVTDK